MDPTLPQEVSVVRNNTANVVDAVRGFDRQVLDFLAAGLRAPITTVENVLGNVTDGISREVSRAARYDQRCKSTAWLT